MENVSETNDILKAILAEIREQKTLVQEQQKEMNELKASMKLYLENWEVEKKSFLDKIEKLEKVMDSKHKKQREKNIVITGLQVQKGEEIEKVKDFVEKQVGVKASVINAYSAKNGTIIAEMDTKANKQEIMKNKNKIKDRSIYINHDLTPEERMIQAELRKIARDHKSKGKKAIVKYRKIILDNEHYEWCDYDNDIRKTPKN